MDRDPIEGETIIKKIALNSHWRSSERNYPRRNTIQKHARAVESDKEIIKLSQKFDA